VSGYLGSSRVQRTDPSAWYWCDHCWKRGYTSRRNAKKCEKALVKLQGDKASHLDVYRCPETATVWHVGHNTRRAA